MQQKKNNGPKTEPQGIPETIEFINDLVCPSWTCCFLFERCTI